MEAALSSGVGKSSSCWVSVLSDGVGIKLARASSTSELSSSSSSTSASFCKSCSRSTSTSRSSLFLLRSVCTSTLRPGAKTPSASCSSFVRVARAYSRFWQQSVSPDAGTRAQGGYKPISVWTSRTRSSVAVARGSDRDAAGPVAAVKVAGPVRRRSARSCCQSGAAPVTVRLRVEPYGDYL